MRSKPQMLDTLTAARFIAALGVVLYHYSDQFTASLGISTSSTPWWQLLLWQGRLGVDFFFLLSGFILAYTYALPDTGMRGTRRAFWVARIARIYPVYLLGLALDLVRFLAVSQRNIGALIANAVSTPLLLRAWLPLTFDNTTWNPPSWSLSVEAVFYLLFPFVIMWLARLSRRQLLLVALASYALFILPPLLIETPGGQTIPWVPTFVISFNPLLRLPEFIIGSALGLLFLRRGNTSIHRSTSRRTHLASDVVLAMLIASAVALTLLPTHRLPPDLFGLLIAPLFAASIYILAHQWGIISGILSHPWLVWLGEISYGVYIVHWPLWSWIRSAEMHFVHVSITSPVLLVTYLGSVITVAGLSYHFIETPARKAIRNRWASTPQGTAPSEIVASVGRNVR